MNHALPEINKVLFRIYSPGGETFSTYIWFYKGSPATAIKHGEQTIEFGNTILHPIATYKRMNRLHARCRIADCSKFNDVYLYKLGTIYAIHAIQGSNFWRVMRF